MVTKCMENPADAESTPKDGKPEEAMTHDLVARLRDRPYSPESLAEHWGCSARHIRKLVSRGKLSCFHVGKLIRIPAKAVKAYEAGEAECDNTGSSDIGASSAPLGTTERERAASRSGRMTGR